MHSLPCASGGEDGVCLALTQLSKELLENDANGLQAGGCDSSDCLFCQYRSNSPFHLNAYAGKLTSLLRKRSINGMALASLNSVVETSTDPGAALSAAVAAPTASGSKRHRTASNHGMTAASAEPVSMGPAPGPFSNPVGFDAASAMTSTITTATHPNLHPSIEFPHDCQTMCAGRRCSTRILQKPFSEAITVTTGAAAGPSKPAGPDPIQVAGASTDIVGLPHEHVALVHGSSGLGYRPFSGATAAASPEATPGDESHPDPGDSATMARPLSTPLWDSVDAPGLVPSSVSLSRLLQPRRHHTLTRHQLRNHHQVHQGGHPHVPPEQQPKLQADTNQERLLSPNHHHNQQQRQRHRLLCGRPLPEGWTLKPEWLHRTDPAPAALREVLRLPAAASFGAQYGVRRGARSGPQGHAGSAACGGSAGIVCAMDFSPDGRLVAAGGVDKQIRLYNLSSVFGDLDLEDEDEEVYDEYTDLQLRCPGSGRCSASRTSDVEDGGGVRRLRNQMLASGSGGDGDETEDDDNNDEQYNSLLTAVQRMPSKISSMSWSPFLDGVLTVGDYDGVLMQLHIASGHQLADVDVHGGRKIWSVAHSCLTPHLAASAADDRCARLWAGRGLSQCVGSLQPNSRASVCCVDFSPVCDHLLALACADRTAYLYDMRSLGRGPLAALRHHSRPASYCRFLGRNRLVTAATDASLALWDISEAIPALTSCTLPQPGMPTTAAAPQLAAMDLTSPPLVVQEYGQAQLPSLHSQQSKGALTTSANEGMSQGAGSVMMSVAEPCRCPGGGGSGAQVYAAVGSIHGSKGEGEGSSGINIDGEPCRHVTGGVTRPCRVFRGHRNEKNFVGLSVRAEDGLLACGSECSRAFAYNTLWSDPLATLEVPWGSTGALSNGGGGGGGVGFVSAVCWQPWEAAAALGLPPLLATATSLGAVSINVLAALR
ncbi:hypothetical protein Vretimale_18776 [Volvox reticuliferus]|uniref:Uncharacterized protein n=1 Tax=Volvox reticuliferus TaxID=1737510 RepID=A0A8J4GXP4_9CHLO|nr:hypothetical protein Vretifemale_19082 [Volvox reticuliferus]GIM16122.1 hypothetical protein Vretimale_18776 [Volvox reticuliferus]